MQLESEASLLAERFEQAFWCEELGTYALALDGAKRPCKVRTSNAGQPCSPASFKQIGLPLVAVDLMSAEILFRLGHPHRRAGRGPLQPDVLP